MFSGIIERENRPRMDSEDGYEICQFNIHTELTFAAKIDTIEKGDDTIQNTIYNTTRKYYAKMLSRCPSLSLLQGAGVFSGQGASLRVEML